MSNCRHCGGKCSDGTECGMNIIADTPDLKVNCNYCGVEHMDGECLDQDLDHYREAVRTHGLKPDISFYKEGRENE